MTGRLPARIRAQVRRELAALPDEQLLAALRGAIGAVEPGGADAAIAEVDRRVAARAGRVERAAAVRRRWRWWRWCLAVSVAVALLAAGAVAVVRGP